MTDAFVSYYRLIVRFVDASKLSVFIIGAAPFARFFMNIFCIASGHDAVGPSFSLTVLLSHAVGDAADPPGCRFADADYREG